MRLSAPRYSFGVAMLVLACVPQIVAAQPPASELRSNPNAPIVVTGERVTRQQARERAATFVRQVGVARGEQSVARWTDRICPRVLGIAQPYAGIVEARMREIGEAAGMQLAPQNCQPNIVVSFVGDAGELVRDIARRSPRRFEQVPFELRENLFNGNAPVRWWYLTETRSREQMRNAPQSLQSAGAADGATSGTSVAAANSPGGGQAQGRIEVEALQQYSSSIISTQAARSIINANVVIDLDAAGGRTLQAVAAYAAFVAFSEVRPSTPPPTGSILGMFGADPQPDSLTDWDMAFLRALYQIPLDRQARRHRGMLVRDMVDFQTRD